MRLGLFQLLFWRVAAVLALTVAMLVLFIHVNYPAPGPFFLRSGPLIGAALIVILAAVAVFPVVAQLRRQLLQLANFSIRVADGELGATMPASGRREIDALIGSLNDMSLRLGQEDQRRRRLLSDVSHELRSPLARVRALAETIGRFPGEASTHLAGIDAEVALMDRLIGDLLQVARFEEQGNLLALQPVPLRDWTAAAFDRQRQRIELAGASCAVSLADGDHSATIDPQRLMQALGNLVENALAAVNGRADPRISLSLAVTVDGWVIAVADNGRGIPAADLPFLFDRFYRVQAHRDRRTGGAGLGLSLVQAIVLAHRGQARVDSTEGQGSVVTMAFAFDAPSVS